MSPKSQYDVTEALYVFNPGLGRNGKFMLMPAEHAENFDPKNLPRNPALKNLVVLHYKSGEKSTYRREHKNFSVELFEKGKFVDKNLGIIYRTDPNVEYYDVLQGMLKKAAELSRIID